ncbi:hypothetical protein [Halarcobacter ebronensis]|uniref:Uncharacterized protein n=1 Tax=Halarcobacter ebronensis TaxID=1462615 RepID=A0A4Q1AMZ4_9BACT|nr:hypothetical protein [Halarcobacter ebronensis]QKF83166.1 hypothetical protein AEBR_2710 [Halarcobacter ebronensis]RXK05196.1 hypothetical protein CRV07_09280 [Halarcobacter ebronensis]
MDKEDLNSARTNPDFLKYLEKTRLDAISSRDIGALYEVLDSFLVLDLDEDKADEIYQNILKITFEDVEEIILTRKLTLKEKDLFYVRAFYEHAIEKWSYENNKGAKELLFVLLSILDDTALCDALKVHIIALSKEKNIDSFYEEDVNLNASQDDEIYGYFITNFNYDLEKYLEENSDILDKEYKTLKHLLDS